MEELETLAFLLLLRKKERKETMEELETLAFGAMLMRVREREREMISWGWMWVSGCRVVFLGGVIDTALVTEHSSLILFYFFFKQNTFTQIPSLTLCKRDAI
jgi:hypothetical protein